MTQLSNTCSNTWVFCKLFESPPGATLQQVVLASRDEKCGMRCGVRCVVCGVRRLTRPETTQTVPGWSDAATSPARPADCCLQSCQQQLLLLSSFSDKVPAVSVSPEL